MRFRLLRLGYQIAFKLMTLAPVPIGLERAREASLPRQVWDLDKLFAQTSEARARSRIGRSTYRQCWSAATVPRMPVPAPTAYAWLDFNAPRSGQRADSLAAALAAAGPATVTDVGCGWGELLLRVLAHAPRARGLGVDSDPTGIARGEANATARGLADRATFCVETLPAELEPADAVICIGSDHVWGTQADALAALRELVLPGGRVLFGSGVWDRPPSDEEAAAIGMTPADLPDLPGLVDLALAAGLRPLRIQTATRDEWEQFESGYLADWEEWLLRHGDDPRAGEIRAQADTHRNEWLRGYREVLGFAYLTLGRPR